MTPGPAAFPPPNQPEYRGKNRRVPASSIDGSPSGQNPPPPENVVRNDASDRALLRVREREIGCSRCPDTERSTGRSSYAQLRGPLQTTEAPIAAIVCERTSV